jgi:hypothetical protein
MSGPVTNVEVEDLLSSIRRLVSDDNCPSMKTARPVTLSPDRLVLTPALRVEDDQDKDEAVVKPTIEAWSGFGARPEDQDTNSVYRSENDSDAASDVNEPEHAEAVQDHDEQPKDETHEVSEVPAAEPFLRENVVNHAETEMDAPFAEMDAPFAEVVEADISDHEAEAAFFADQSESLTSKIVSLEAVIGKTDDQWIPDDTGSSDYSVKETPSMKWDDAGSDSDVYGGEGDNAETDGVDVESQQPAFSQFADEFLDEDALRYIVSKIVREELQAALGERITRNVRKLVRREIHRALAAQELE